MEQKDWDITKKIGLAVGISVVSLLVMAYFIMVWYAGRYFMPGVFINGTSVSGMTAEEVKDKLREEGSKYSLTVHFRGGDVAVDEDDIHYVQDYSRDVDRIRNEQNPYTWFFGMEESQETAKFEMSYDKSLFYKILVEKGYLDENKMVSPENPSIEYIDEKYVVVEKDCGNVLDPEEVMEKLDSVVLTKGGYFNVEEEGLYREPSYKADSFIIQNCLEKANGYLDSKITYTMGELEIPVTKDDLSNFIKIDKDYKCSVSKFQIDIFVQNMAEKYDTYRKPKKFYTYYGHVVNYEDEYYGWQIDTEEESLELKNDILRGEVVNREPCLNRSGETLRMVNGRLDDIGGTYAEVDISSQHMWMYYNGKVVLDSDFVSGHVGLGRGTPGGIFRLSYKERDTFLVGADYRTHVDYWMPFNGGIGFHDANWRGAFGGTIYTYDGSHGCVNLPVSAAAQLYDYVYGGMPVIVY